MRQTLLLMVRMGHKACDKTVRTRDKSRSGRGRVQNREERVVRLRKRQGKASFGRWQDGPRPRGKTGKLNADLREQPTGQRNRSSELSRNSLGVRKSQAIVVLVVSWPGQARGL